MTKIFAQIITASLVLFSTASLARPPLADGKYIEVRPGRVLYVEHRPAQNGKPTLFFINGLTYDTSQWRVHRALTDLDPDLGVVLYDMKGQGRTLRRDGAAEEIIPMEDQIEDLHALIAALAVRGQRVALGLSYGGAVVIRQAATYPNDFSHYIAAAPFLERLPEQDAWINERVSAHRFTFPMDWRNSDDIYDQYLFVLMAATYPAAEPVILTHPHGLEAVYQMIRGAKRWNAAAFSQNLPREKVHVIAATRDEFVKIDRVENYLSRIPQGSLASVLLVRDSALAVLHPSEKFHKITETHPELIAKWIKEILHDNPLLRVGKTFTVEPETGLARSEDSVIPLLVKKRLGLCEEFLSSAMRLFLPPDK